MNNLKFVILGNHYVFLDLTKWPTNEHWATFDFDPAKTYDKADTVFIINEFAIADNIPLVESILDLGHKVIVDAVWEIHSDEGIKLWEKYGSNVLIMRNGTHNNSKCDNIALTPRYFWIRESGFNKASGVDKYVPNRKIDKQFLMPMGKSHPARSIAYERFKDCNAIISYQARDLNLSMLQTDSNMLISDPVRSDRDFNSDWYDSTYFSVVAESSYSRTPEEGGGMPEFISPKLTGVSITEKTFKPIAFEHPFVIWGTWRTITYLRDIGFETYDHIFDHSYDQHRSFKKRFDLIQQCVDNFDVDAYNSKLTVEMMQYNRAHFYSTENIVKILQDEIINPIMEFVYSSK